jgi:hypothetical protein
MKKRWAFFLSLALGVFAICLQSWYFQQSSDAKHQLTEYWMRYSDPDNPPTAEVMAEAFRVAQASPAKAQLRSAGVAALIGMPAAAMSALCLFLSHRRKEAARRWLVGALLILYFILGSL